MIVEFISSLISLSLIYSVSYWIFIAFIFLCVCAFGTAHVWRPEDYLEPALSFYHIDPRDQTQIVSLGSNCFYTLSLLASQFQVFYSKFFILFD